MMNTCAYSYEDAYMRESIRQVKSRNIFGKFFKNLLEIQWHYL